MKGQLPIGLKVVAKPSNGQISSNVASPLISEVFDLKEYPQIRWWERVRAELMHLIHSASS